MTEVGTQYGENEVITIIDQTATKNANLTHDNKEDQECSYVNESCLDSPENEVFTSDNVAYKRVNRHGSNEFYLNSDAAYSSNPNPTLHL